MFILLAVDDSTPTNPLESLNWGFVIFVVVYALAIVVSICFSGKTPFFTRFGAMLRVKCKTTYFSLLHRQLQLDCNDLPPEAQPIYRLLANKTEEDLSTQFKNFRSRLLEIWEGAPGSQRQSWWDAYNTVTYWLTHEAARTEENRMASLLYGVNSAVSLKALKLGLKNAGFNPKKS
mgnify:CR=1 FL=1